MRDRNIVPRRTPIHQMREPYATIVDRVMERDREWFKAHPGEISYRRQYIPGELNPDALAQLGAARPDQDCVVEVTRVAPGMRIRTVVRPGRNGCEE